MHLLRNLSFIARFFVHFYWISGIFCDISSGKIKENLRLKAKRILFKFFVTFPRISRTTMGKEFFWIFCDISSGKILGYLGQKAKRFFSIFCNKCQKSQLILDYSALSNNTVGIFLWNYTSHIAVKNLSERFRSEF